MSMNELSGHQFTAEWYGCTADLYDSKQLQEVCVREVERSGLNKVNALFHSFGVGMGVTGVVLLGESHLAIHTWPELEGITIDLYVCNFSKTGSKEKAEMLMAALKRHFNPKRGSERLWERGEKSCIRETVAPGHVLEMDLRGVLASGHTGLQSYEVVDTVNFGRALRLDGVIQTTEKDEHLYHEPLVQLPLLAHPNPKRVVLIGGGDGGAAKEVLKHESVNCIRWMEIDQEVVRQSKKWLETIHQGSFDHPKVNLTFEGGVSGLAQCKASKERFDCVIFDLTDAFVGSEVGLAGRMHALDTYRLAKDVMTKDGVLALHAGSVYFQSEEVQKKKDALRAVFTHVVEAQVFIPKDGSEWSFLFGTDSAVVAKNMCEPSAAVHVSKDRGIRGLRWIRERMHVEQVESKDFVDLKEV